MARDTVMKKPKDTRGTLRRMLQYLGPWRAVIAGVAVLSLFSNVLNLWGPSLGNLFLPLGAEPRTQHKGSPSCTC